ncbi:RagB/SusD family nutrient uptake outer membrane protein [Salegentibacter flavus]|uniref:Starch-binding associating with outer membrane n=1 Tax=Salegentibacter flavus TaxID=287099 RepID=A0A1I5CT07_9FLAO|nr:RagB/SusD family nutrient uptake outer membrane protein [Salegentibacter flavus]SFN90073.1 Starch-binding associating with outer membrane [Salegentibacter flavus]
MKLNKYLLIVPFILFLSSCDEDRLDLYPLTTLSEGTFYQDLSQIESAVDDVYRQIGRLYDSRSIPSLYGILYSDNGEVVAQLAGTPVYQPIDNHEITADNPLIEEAWDVAYNAIFITNNLIEQLETTEVEISEDYKKRMIAEVKLVRSLAYFNLVRAFGAVPLITESISAAEAYDYLREDPDKVYEQIINDLTLAKNDLPANYSGGDVGRVTQYSAAAVLAKIHLTRGEITAAQTELEFIINSGEFSLDANNDGTVNVEDYLYIFKSDTKNSKSSILEAQYMSGVNAANSRHQTDFSPYAEDWRHPWIDESIVRGTGFNIPTDDLASEFESGDLREEITVVPGYENASGIFREDAFTLKYFDPNWWNPGQNFEIIRYADILLMYAEVTGDPEYLNMVRDRVDLPPYGSPDYPSALYPTLELAIEHERRMELAMEMHRFFDLVRTGRAVEVMQVKVPSFDSDKLLFPIPLYAIDVNPGLTQNPGY